MPILAGLLEPWIETTQNRGRINPYSLQTSAGKKVYAQRKVTSEPVYGIIKEVMGFRRFLVRGFAAVQGEWNLVCMAYNIKKLYALTA